jgi:hypothetical protein
VALVDEAALELLLEVVEGSEWSRSITCWRLNVATRSSGGIAGASTAALHVGAEERAEPPRHVLPGVMRALAQRLPGDLSEDAARAERGGAAGELAAGAQMSAVEPGIR